MKFKSVLLIASLSTIMACEDVIDLDLSEGDEKFVVEGEMTNLPGPYQVRITRTSNPTTNEVSPLVEDALVMIKDDASNIDTLNYVGDGIYETQNLQGVIGRMYTLEFKTSGGSVYESQPQLLKEVYEIDSLYARENTEIQGGDFLDEGFYAVVDYTEPAGRDFYRWKIYKNDSLFDDAFDIQVEDDDGLIPNAPVRERPLVGFVFDVGDTARVEIYSISREVYDFWTIFLDQASASGGPFDTPPAPIIGNVFNVDNPDEQVLGVFAVSAVNFKEVVIEEEE